MKRNLYNLIKVLSLLVILCVLLKSMGCSKRYDYTSTQDTVKITNNTHCSNGIKDYDETGVDCGGKDCNACPVIVVNVPCTTTPNNISIRLNSGSSNTFTGIPIHQTDKYGDYTLKGLLRYTNDTLCFTFRHKPTTDSIYAMVNIWPQHSEVLSYISSGGSYNKFFITTYTTAYAYVKIISGKIHLYICNADYYDDVYYDDYFCSMELVDN